MDIENSSKYMDWSTQAFLSSILSNRSLDIHDIINGRGILQVGNGGEIAVLSFIIYTSLYSISHFCKIFQKPESHCRLASFWHALVTTFFVIHCCFIIGPHPYSQMGKPNTTLQNRILLHSLGFFIFELLWFIYYQRNHILVIIHHAGTITGITRILTKGQFALECIYGLGLVEITIPLLQIRYLWWSEIMHSNDTRVCVELAFFLHFLVFRVYLGFYWVKTLIFSPLTDAELKVYCSFAYMFTVFYLVRIIHYIKWTYFS